MAEIEKLVKGGDCWFELAIDRTSKGIKVWARADPRIEEFFSKLGQGESDPLSHYEALWTPVPKEMPLRVYRLNDVISSENFNIDAVGGGLGSTSIPNLSFLRIQGIGGQGISFTVNAPPSTPEYLRTITRVMLLRIKSIVNDYIVPVHINLRLSSLEV